MSVIKNNLGRFSSFLSSKNINNRQFKFSGFFSTKKKSNIFSFHFGKTNNNNDLKPKKSEIYNLSKSPSIILPNKQEEEKQIIINPESKNNYKSLLSYVKTSFTKKYTDIYYKFQGDYLIFDNNNYLLYDYYRIRDITENKKCSLLAHLNELKIFDNKKEFLIGFYKSKERNLIMNYLLNFIYKYDKLCYDKNKEIINLQTKEEIIKTFYHLTSEQYNYERLFDSDYFKGNQNLLKYINLSNKRASYDYSVLDMTKNNLASQENVDIINALKIINEYISNRNFIEGKLIKNFPIEKVPNIVPMYFSLGRKMQILLSEYYIKRKIEKIENHEETKALIDKYREDFSKKQSQKKKSALLKGKLTNIEEKIEEDITGKSKENINKNKSKKNKNNLDNKKILAESLYYISDLSDKKQSFDELDEQKKDNNDINNNNKNNDNGKNNNKNKETLNEFPKDFHKNQRNNNDDEANDIENFIKKLIHNTKKIYLISPKNYNKIKKEIKHPLIANNKNSKNKSKIDYFKFIKKYNNQNSGESPSKKYISSSISNFKNSSSIIKTRNLNNISFGSNIKKSPHINNILSLMSRQINYIYSKKNNSFNNSQELSKLNNKIINGYKKFSKYNKISNSISMFKETNKFIKESIDHKKKMTLKRKIILRNFSKSLNSTIQNSNSSYFNFGDYSQKKSLSMSPNKSLKIRRLFKKTDFEKMVTKMNKRLKINKIKESKLCTQEQILKNCEIYNFIYN